MTTTEIAVPKITSDFDFLVGTWSVANRQLKQPLSGSDEWVEFEAELTGQTNFNGAVSIDEITFPSTGLAGMSIRIYDPATGEWSIYWVASRYGQLQPPVVGRWTDGVIEAFADEEFEGRPVVSRYRWSEITPTTATWDQALSADGRVTWETNWIMHLTRKP